MRRLLAILSTLIVLSFRTVAQIENVENHCKDRDLSSFKVAGTLRDSVTEDPLVYVNVAILDSADSSIVKSGATDFDGDFVIASVPAGAYLLRISFMGYQSRYLPFRVENNVTLGTIFLMPAATMLKTVNVTAQRPLYAVEGEKLIYNVSDDPSIQSGTTSDALQNAPGVEVDIEGNVTLRGISSVEIWVNDKPSKLTSENLKTFLETLPANALARIETITNPSAKYGTKAEAVINIVTSAHIKKNHFVSFGVNGASQPSVSPWLSYLWANERLSINIYGSARFNRNKDASRKENWKLDNNFDTVSHECDTSYSERERFGSNIFLTINYAIDSMTDISVDGNLNTSHNTSCRSISHLRNDDILTYLYDDQRQERGHNTYGSLGADYVKKFDKKGHKLRITFNGQYDFSNDSSTFVRNYDPAFIIPTSGNQDKYYLSSGLGNSMYLNGRYNRPYGKNDEMSYGLRFDYDNDFDRYNPRFITSEGYSTDSLRCYTFRSKSFGASGDLNWTHRWGGFTLELGLGANISNIMGGHNMGQTVRYSFLQDQFSRTDLTFTPSVHTSYRTKDMQNFMLNYSFHMRNPNPSQLSTFRNYSEDSYTTGNPNLLPSYAHKAEIGWSKFFTNFGNIWVQAYVNYNTNEIDDLTDVQFDNYLDRIIQYSMPENLGKSYNYGLNVNTTCRLSKFFNVYFYGNVYHSGYLYNYAKLGQVCEAEMWSYSLLLNTWVKFFNKFQIHASAYYTSPTLSLFSTRKTRYFLNCGVRGDFFKRKLSLFVNVKDIFNWGKTQGSGSTSDSPFIISNNSTYAVNSRYVSAGITFRFGKMELERYAKEGSEKP